MRPINFQPCELTFTTQDFNNDITYLIEGIRFEEDKRVLFIVTKLLCEKIPYTKHEGKEAPVKVGNVLELTHTVAQDNIVMDEKKYKYWTQFLKMRRL